MIESSGSGIPLWVWAAFNVFVLAMLALDLGVFHRKSHEVKFKEAIAWSAVWIGLALAFNTLLFTQWMRIAPGSEYSPREAGMAFLAGYLIEKALSVDNIFVFLMIFAYFRVPVSYQHKVLFWGIIGALVMRAICIAAGVTLLDRFHWLIYVFGAFLILTGIKMLFSHGKQIEPEKNPLLKLFRRIVPVTSDYVGDKFFVRLPASTRDANAATSESAINDAASPRVASVSHTMRLWATPLFVALIFVEMSDLIFAVDSIPAILAITREPFIVYTSNVFAILGLRALFFALAGVMGMFAYLHYGLSAVLVFVGGKMIATGIIGKIPTALSLGIVVAILAVAVLSSIFFPPKKAAVIEVAPS
jgi:tellurite resistance protein TerC